MSEQTQHFVTSDIGIAAYLQLQGIKLLSCRRLENGKFYFQFDDTEQNCRIKSLEFLESDFCKFDNNVRNLKKVLFS